MGITGRKSLEQIPQRLIRKEAHECLVWVILHHSKWRHMVYLTNQMISVIAQWVFVSIIIMWDIRKLLLCWINMSREGTWIISTGYAPGNMWQDWNLWTFWTQWITNDTTYRPDRSCESSFRSGMKMKGLTTFSPSVDFEDEWLRGRQAIRRVMPEVAMHWCYFIS